MNLTPPSSGFGNRMSEFTVPVHMFSLLLVSVRCLKIWVGPKLPLFVEGLAEDVKGSKERCLLGQNTTWEFLGWPPLSSYKTTLKQQLNSEKRWKMSWRVNPLIFFGVSYVQCSEDWIGMTVTCYGYQIIIQLTIVIVKLHSCNGCQLHIHYASTSCQQSSEHWT